MTAPQTFRDLATLIECVEAAEISVDGVRTNERDDAETLDAAMTARIRWEPPADLDGRVSVDLPDEIEAESGDSSRELTVPLRIEIDADGGDAAESNADAARLQVTDGGVPAPAAAVDDGRPAVESPGSDGSEGRKEDSAAPAHRDPERLRAVYEDHETFAEMTEALGVTVTSQTVRRQMIRHGIHRPSRQRERGADADASTPEDAERSTEETEEKATDSADADESAEAVGADAEESTDGDDAEPTDGRAGGESPAGEEPETGDAERTDGGGDDPDDRAAGASERESPVGEAPPAVDLPSHVSLEDIREAVADATTLYEVQRSLRVDRSKARRILTELNLLDLVGGRVATAENRRTTVEEIDERIRRAEA